MEQDCLPMCRLRFILKYTLPLRTLMEDMLIQVVNPDDRGIIPANRAYQDINGERIWLAGSYTTPSGTLPDAGSNNPNGNVADIIPQKNF